MVFSREYDRYGIDGLRVYVVLLPLLLLLLPPLVLLLLLLIIRPRNAFTIKTGIRYPILFVLELVYLQNDTPIIFPRELNARPQEIQGLIAILICITRVVSAGDSRKIGLIRANRRVCFVLQTVVNVKN